MCAQKGVNGVGYLLKEMSKGQLLLCVAAKTSDAHAWSQVLVNSHAWQFSPCQQDLVIVESLSTALSGPAAGTYRRVRHHDRGPT
jgi:hypothetical protein